MGSIAHFLLPPLFDSPAKAGAQEQATGPWTPAFAGDSIGEFAYELRWAWGPSLGFDESSSGAGNWTKVQLPTAGVGGNESRLPPACLTRAGRLPRLARVF